MLILFSHGYKGSKKCTPNIVQFCQGQGSPPATFSILTFHLNPFGCGVLLLSIAAFSVLQFLTLSILALLCVAKEVCTGKNWEKQFIAVYSSFKQGKKFIFFGSQKYFIFYQKLFRRKDFKSSTPKKKVLIFCHFRANVELYSI